MKNVVLLSLLSTLLFIGCSSKQARILEPREVIIPPKEVVQNKVKNNINLETAKSLKIKAKELEAKKALEKQRLAEEKKRALKERLDREALINADKELKAEEVQNYTIDENTPLILKNQSEERAYE